MSGSTVSRREIEEFLIDRGAAEIPHPGGNLFDHLIRVEEILSEWDASTALRTAGLCHATYGTDGFRTSLLGAGERAALRALIGSDAERLVYIYGCCDRNVVYPQLGAHRDIEFRDRFTGTSIPLSEVELRSFLDLTVANELDVMAHNEDVAREHGPALLSLFTRVRAALSPAAKHAVDRFFN